MRARRRYLDEQESARRAERAGSVAWAVFGIWFAWLLLSMGWKFWPGILADLRAFGAALWGAIW